MINGILVINELTFDYGISLNKIIAVFGMSILFSSEKIADYDVVVKSGRFGNYLLQKYPNAPSAGYCKFVYANFSARWEIPLREMFDLFKIATRECLSEGNIAMGLTPSFVFSRLKFSPDFLLITSSTKPIFTAPKQKIDCIYRR